MPDWDCMHNELCSSCVDRIEQLNDLFNESRITPHKYKECVADALLKSFEFANKCNDYDSKHFLDFIFYSDVAVKSASSASVDIFLMKNMIQSYRSGKALDDIFEHTHNNELNADAFTRIDIDCSCI